MGDGIIELPSRDDITPFKLADQGKGCILLRVKRKKGIHFSLMTTIKEKVELRESYCT